MKQFDFRIGTLVRWHGQGTDDDPNDLGIVIEMPGENGWTGNYHIAVSYTHLTLPTILLV